MCSKRIMQHATATSRILSLRPLMMRRVVHARHLPSPVVTCRDVLWHAMPCHVVPAFRTVL